MDWTVVRDRSCDGFFRRDKGESLEATRFAAAFKERGALIAHIVQTFLRQLPVNFGLRFSMNALAPSLWSCVYSVS
ncbi:hypothetical protein GCM10011487_40580 [Steroidobacter agaridevorans]|uniref:Uncharacterized protein n=1 Tax=Steroidobacter agaridevorans TaxID=2695856 RepID=A0A829YGX9_9GAMM|nr:hypothetical protein GCM10011487_40580 [Steroidobacter agaridevorans]